MCRHSLEGHAAELPWVWPGLSWCRGLRGLPASATELQRQSHRGRILKSHRSPRKPRWLPAELQRFHQRVPKEYMRNDRSFMCIRVTAYLLTLLRHVGYTVVRCVDLCRSPNCCWVIIMSGSQSVLDSICYVLLTSQSLSNWRGISYGKLSSTKAKLLYSQISSKGTHPHRN